MGAQIYINKHSSAAKVPFGAQNINSEHDAPQARRNNHAHAGTGITQGTATQWSIFEMNFWFKNNEQIMHQPQQRESEPSPTKCYGHANVIRRNTADNPCSVYNVM